MIQKIAILACGLLLVGARPGSAQILQWQDRGFLNVNIGGQGKSNDFTTSLSRRLVRRGRHRRNQPVSQGRRVLRPLRRISRVEQRRGRDELRAPVGRRRRQLLGQCSRPDRLQSAAHRLRIDSRPAAPRNVHRHSGHLRHSGDRQSRRHGVRGPVVRKTGAGHGDEHDDCRRPQRTDRDHLAGDRSKPRLGATRSASTSAGS